MITFIFLAAIVLLAVAGVGISIMAKKRRDGSAERPASNVTDAPKMGRASGPGDD